MSHFAVCVITKADDEEELVKLLAPYQENNYGDCPKEYMEFVDEEDENFEEYQNGSCEMVRCPDGSLKYRWDDAFRIPGEIGIGTDTHKVPEGEGYEHVNVYHKDRFKSFEEYMEEYVGYNGHDPETNRYGHWENPNAKWDYWSVAGRFGAVPLKNGSKVPCAKIKDVAFEGTEKEIREAERFWEIVVEGSELLEGEEQPFTLYRKEYYEDQYGTKENYVKQNTGLGCWAFVDQNGWHEKGRMGWWTANSATKDSREEFGESFEQAVKNADPESYITIVDCHI